MSNLMKDDISNDALIIDGTDLGSRLIMGTGKYPDDTQIPVIAEASGATVVTVALRRINLSSPEDNILENIPDKMKLMANTSGARTAEEAVRIAELARAAGCGNWIKVEVISDSRYLLPDGYETVKASEELVKRGFTVFPYVNPDLMVGRALRDAGCSAVMPLGAPIGSNRGLRTEEMIGILIEEIDLPIIVDAGIGAPSHACQAMEMGAAACMINTAIASAGNPAQMAKAFRQAIAAGRTAYLSGTASVRKEAAASSPLTGFLYE